MKSVDATDQSLTEIVASRLMDEGNLMLNLSHRIWKTA